jgi:poly(A) polymerase
MLKEILLSDNAVEKLIELDTSGDLKNVEPTLAALRMEIPKGYHHKDNLTHSIQVLQNAINRETNGPDLILRTAALFHDIGKPATRAFHDKGVVTFVNHETVGANMVNKILIKHGYVKKDIKTIAMLIRFHMRSHGFTTELWTDSAIRRLITDVGDEQNMQKLVTIFYSDVTTQFAKKKANMHASVTGLVEMIKEVQEQDARKALRPALNGNEVMELFDLKPGAELGKIMKFLNTDEGIKLTKEEAIKEIQNSFL